MSMEDLVAGDPVVERIVFRQAQLRAERQANGDWNITSLIPLPKFSEHTPAIVIEDASVILEDAERRQGGTLIIRGIDATLTPPTTAGGRYALKGTVTGMAARDLRLEGELDPARGGIDLTIVVNGLEITPELLVSVPGFPIAAIDQTHLSGRADATVRIQRAAGPGKLLEWSADVKVDRGQLNHPALPRPLTDLAIQLKAEPSRLLIERLTGKCGTAEVDLACERRGWNLQSPLGSLVRVVGLPLDDRFAAALPASLARFWKRFEPSGLVDAEVRLAFDGQRWRPHIRATGRGLGLTDTEKFCYQLTQGSGTLEYAPASEGSPDALRLDLTADAGGRPVRIEAQLSQLTSQTGSPRTDVPPSPAPHPVGWVEISGTDISVHEQLIAAMPEKAQQLVRSLRPQGKFDFRWRAEWADSLQPKADVSQDIVLKDCAIQHQKFPYPLYHVHGLVTQRNRRWQLHDVEGRGGNDSTLVTCRGESLPADDGFQLDLLIQAQNVPLDDNLRQALSPPAQRAWSELRPQGRVDFAAHVVHASGQAIPAVAVTLAPREKSVSIEPQAFPYRLEQLSGVATFQNGMVTLANVEAHHDRATYSAKSGSWQATPAGGWQFELTGFHADRLTSQRDLLIALPPRLQNLLERLQPTGTFGVSNSTLRFAKNPQLGRVVAAWDVNLVCLQAALQGGIPLEHISGEVHLVGQDDGQASSMAGELAVDSVVWKDMQFTNVRGPIWVDRSVCLLGQPASQKLGQQRRRVTADAYGGSLAGDMRIEHDGNPRYQLEVALGGAELGRFAGERLGGPTELGGTVAGTLKLSGTGRSTHSLNGSGELHIVDAKIYELPVLVALLKVLKIRTPDTTAFDRCDMQFAIQGEHVHFHQLNLLGDAVSLYGRGETNFDRQLNLVFYSLVGPVDLPIPLWKTIAGQVSQQGLQLKVSGTWENPETEKDVLPSVNQVLQEIQTGIQAGARTVAPPSAMRTENVSTRR
jgi:hypothetical protein